MYGETFKQESLGSSELTARMINKRAFLNTLQSDSDIEAEFSKMMRTLTSTDGTFSTIKFIEEELKLDAQKLMNTANGFLQMNWGSNYPDEDIIIEEGIKDISNISDLSNKNLYLPRSINVMTFDGHNTDVNLNIFYYEENSKLIYEFSKNVGPVGIKYIRRD